MAFGVMAYTVRTHARIELSPAIQQVIDQTPLTVGRSNKSFFLKQIKGDTLQRDLKERLGFKGWVTSDWAVRVVLAHLVVANLVML